MGITRKAWGPLQKSRKYTLPARKRRVEFEKERSSWGRENLGGKTEGVRRQMTYGRRGRVSEVAS